MSPEEEIAEQDKVREETVGLVDELFSRTEPPGNTLDTGVHFGEGLSRCYEVLVGNDVSSGILRPDGSFSPPQDFPKELAPAVEAVSIRALSSEELLANHERRQEVLSDMKERSRDMLWYRQLFRDLLSYYDAQMNAGIMDGDKRQRNVFQAATALASFMLSELQYDVSQSGGRGTYILGVSDNSRVWRKPLPGYDTGNPEFMKRWFKNIFELGGNAATFYGFDPEILNGLVKEGWWTHVSNFKDYPAIPNGFQVGSQMLAFGFGNKEYVNSQPHEIINLAGDLNTITVIDESSLPNPRQAVLYKVNHKNGGISVGEITRDSSGRFKFWPSDFPIAGWTDGVINFSQYDGLYALAGAIARDMMVLGKEYKYEHFKVKERGKKKPRHESQADTIVRWIPRFRVVYPRRLGYDPEKLERDVDALAPQQHVSGHPRRTSGTPDPAKRALARQFNVTVPLGWTNWTYVKEYDREGYEAQRTYYKSHSAMQTLFGERRAA